MQKWQSHHEASLDSFQLGFWEEEAVTKEDQPLSLVLVWGDSQECAAPAASIRAAGCGTQQPDLQEEERKQGWRGRLGATECQGKTGLFL